MARPVLVGYDPQTRDHAPVHFGVMVSRHTGAPLIVAAVQSGPRPVALGSEQTVPFAIAAVDEELVPDCHPAVKQLQEDLEPEGVQVECRALRGASVPAALHEAAEAERAGLLVVGSTDRGPIGRTLPGSTAERLLHGAPCPVAVVPRRWTRDGEPETIGVAFIDTAEGREALRGAHALARRLGARLRVLTVVRVTLTMYAETEARTATHRAKYLEDVLGEHKVQAVRAAERAVAELGDGVEVTVDGFIGEPGEVLADLSRHLDLLVCGSRGYGPLRAVLLGGVSRRIVSDAHCPVIVLPRGVEASLEALLAEAERSASSAGRSSQSLAPHLQR
jgi:nucleotide-binding universal stress UspA family protein